MFAFAKFGPTDYVIHFTKGRVKREGRGLSFFYWMPTGAIASVGLADVSAQLVVPAHAGRKRRKGTA